MSSRIDSSTLYRSYYGGLPKAPVAPLQVHPPPAARASWRSIVTGIARAALRRPLQTVLNRDAVQSSIISEEVALYRLGVHDDGTEEGISQKDLKESLQVLKDMASAVDADVTEVQIRKGSKKSLFVAEVFIRKRPEDTAVADQICVAALGPPLSGKSTAIAVLTTEMLDNGRGLARMMTLRHRHEIENGTTSSVSASVMELESEGADDDGDGVTNVVMLVDLPSKEEFVKTTVGGITAHDPDFVMLTASANMGAGGTEAASALLVRHVWLATSLGIPMFVLLTKRDVASEESVAATIAAIESVVKSASRDDAPRMLRVRTDDDVEQCAEDLRLCRGRREKWRQQAILGIFVVSSVTGGGIDNVRALYARLFSGAENASKDTIASATGSENRVVLSIQEVWPDGVEGVGPVVAGCVSETSIKVGMRLLLGPDDFGGFHPCIARSIHDVHRQSVRKVGTSQRASVALEFDGGLMDEKGSSYVVETTAAETDEVHDRDILHVRTAYVQQYGAAALEGRRRQAFRRGAVLLENVAKSLSSVASSLARWEFKATFSLKPSDVDECVGRDDLVVHSRAFQQSCQIFGLPQSR